MERKDTGTFPGLEPEEAARLARRMGAEALRRRLFLEENRERRLWGLVRWCPMKYAGPAADLAFRCAGLWKRAHREFLDIRVRE